MSGPMSKVMATGVFDILHLGHIHYLESSKRFGDYMVVVIATDAMAKKHGKDLIFSENYRKEMVSSIRYVDEVIIGQETDIYKTVEKVKPDIITLGFDQQFDEKIIEKECSERGMQVKVVRCPKFISNEPVGTRFIRRKILERGELRN